MPVQAWHWIAAGLAAAAVLTAWVLKRRRTSDLARFNEAVEQFTAGRLDHRVDLPASRELQPLARALNSMAARLETRLKSLEMAEKVRKDFVANVSHELKTPLTSIKGFVETLGDTGFEDEAESRRFLEIILRHSDRMNTIVDDLLVLSRLDERGIEGEVPMEETPVLGALERAVELNQVDAKEYGVQVAVDCSDRLVAWHNPNLLEQALSNLVSNAVKYSPAGSVVTVTAAPSGERVEIRVSDKGKGIAPEHLQRLFERFYRVDKGRSRQEGGTGLGLAIVKHVAQVMDGSVEVSSREGEGSTFSLFLPARSSRS